MHRFGHLVRLPRILGVQARGAAPIYDAWQRGPGHEHIEEVPGQTLADSINVGAPKNGVKALRAVRDSAGAMITVTDGEILAAMFELGQVGGVFGEPAGVAALAGIKHALAEGIIQPGESVAQVVTGSGLKDIRAADQAAPAALRVEPRLEAVRGALLEATRARAMHLAAAGLPSYGTLTHGQLRIDKKL